MHCQICSSNELIHVTSLGHHALPDVFVAPQEAAEPFTVYPLDLYVCGRCWLAQIGHAVDPALLFRDFVYTTESNPASRPHFQRLVDSLVERFQLGTEDLAVDLASNDGTLLEQYAGRVRVLGVDPSSTTGLAIAKGLPTIVDFFTEATAEKILATYQPAKVITTMNAFAHIKELDAFMSGVVTLLAEDGVFVTESHHLQNVITKMHYDLIHHEHLRFYSLQPLTVLFARYGLEVFDVEETATQGGSILVYAGRTGVRPVSANVPRLLEQETAAGLYSIDTYQAWTARLMQSKQRLMSLLYGLKAQGATIAGIGASAKGNTILNYCGIRPDVLDYITDGSELKQGKLAPGSLIPVTADQELLDRQPDYALVLTSNLKDIIIRKLTEKGYQGKFIVAGEVPSVE
ncbi:class I SAM-dependent methyltransferase [Dactylosporangium sp. NPDC050588]|uniref:Putative C-methyltransferase n=1 Tax=Dactylosporangium aurantiacum subsp. hamdenensis TaxID=703577 RepID=E9LIM4_9ACTN|nr:putative C-methyltransferase [Dactylosporangium aurantiacum subsp. hamdenensis]